MRTRRGGAPKLKTVARMLLNLRSSQKHVRENPSDKCPICLEHIQGPSFKLPCKHRFHKPCLRSWVHSGRETAHECPLCRTPIPEKFRGFGPIRRGGPRPTIRLVATRVIRDAES